MSLSKYLQRIALLANDATKPEKALARLGEAANESMRYNTLRSLERSLERGGGSEPVKKMLADMGSGAKIDLRRSSHPNVPAGTVRDMETRITDKFDDSQKFKGWTQAGQPSMKTLNEFSEDMATPYGDSLGLSAQETEKTMDTASGLYKWLGGKPNVTDDMIEKKIPGFTKWLAQRQK